MLDDSRDSRENYEKGLANHRIASRNYKLVLEKARALEGCASTIKDLYDGSAIASCAPSDKLQLTELFLHWDNIASTHFFVQPHLGPVVNGLMILYGIDKGNCFLPVLDQIKFNLVLIVLVWAHFLVGDAHNHPILQSSSELWYSFVMAWMESMDSETKFDAHMAYLDAYNTSEYGLTWFGSSAYKVIESKLYELEQALPPLQGDPRDLVHNCRVGNISVEELKEVGPNMALHFLLATERSNRLEKEEEVRRKEEIAQPERDAREAEKEDILMKEEYGWELQEVGRYQMRLEALAAGEEVSDDESEPEEDSAAPICGEGEEDGMEMDVYDEFLIPYGVDVAEIGWDSKMLQDLLAIDGDIPARPANAPRPKTGRTPWMADKDGVAFLIKEVEGFVDAFAGLVCKSSMSWVVMEEFGEVSSV